MYGTSKGIIENFAYIIDKRGFIPNSGNIQYSYIFFKIKNTEDLFNCVKISKKSKKGKIKKVMDKKYIFQAVTSDPTPSFCPDGQRLLSAYSRQRVLN